MVNTPSTIIKTILTDLDGTAVESLAMTISDVVHDSLIQARDRGIHIAAVTGRPFELALPVLRAMGLDGYNVVDGGATITHGYEGEIVWTCELTAESVRDVVTNLSKYAHAIHYDNTIGLVRDISMIDIKSISRPSAHVWASVDVAVVEQVMLDLALIPDVIAHANPGPGGDFSLTGIQVTDIHADKTYGVRKLMEYIDTRKKETLSVGDGNNDLPLFAMSEVRVAMGNSPDALKDAADYVVGTVEQDGFAQAVAIAIKSHSI